MSCAISLGSFSKENSARMDIFLSCHVGHDQRDFKAIVMGSFNREHLHFQWDFSANKSTREMKILFQWMSYIFLYCAREFVCGYCMISYHLSSFFVNNNSGTFMISLSSLSFDAALTEWHTKNQKRKREKTEVEVWYKFMYCVTIEKLITLLSIGLHNFMHFLGFVFLLTMMNFDARLSNL